jgi:hypothetical protein
MPGALHYVPGTFKVSGTLLNPPPDNCNPKQVPFFYSLCRYIINIDEHALKSADDEILPLPKLYR